MMKGIVRNFNGTLALVLVVALATFKLIDAGSAPFFDWIDRASVMEDLMPSDEDLGATSFLEYVSVDPRAMAATTGCDGSFDCAQFQEEGQQAEEPPAPQEYYKPAKQPKKVTFPVGRLPRQAKCFIKCDYKESYEFKVGSMIPEESTPSSFPTPVHATKAHARHHAAAASSFLELEADNPDAIPVNNVGSPFHCQTSCDFPQPLWCNPVRRMVVGSAGFTPQEHPCCDLCEAKCRSKTVVERFRVCYMGCRSFCPFAA